MNREVPVLQVVCIKQVPDTETRVKLAADCRRSDVVVVCFAAAAGNRQSKA